MKFLITAGPTKEYIDPVRFISNASSGKMGHLLAQAAIAEGYEVILVTAANLEPPKHAKIIKVETTDQMFRAVKDDFDSCDCLIMAAAVADYTPEKISSIKIKKTKDENLSLTLVPTTDILRWAGEHKKTSQIVVGFALEDQDILKNAAEKMAAKKLDMIIANSPKAINADSATVYIKTRAKQAKWQTMENAAKKTIAAEIIDLVTGLM